MANNRMFLVHPSTKQYICIGRRMGTGWYIKDPEKFGERLQSFFNSCWDAGTEDWSDQDQFFLAMEDTERAFSSTIEITELDIMEYIQV